MKNVGSNVTSLINHRLVSGRGTYVADIHLDGMLHMAVLRSPYAHARINSIDTTAAEAQAGVVYVITGKEVHERMGPIPEAYDKPSVGAKSYKWWPLALERTRFVGEPVAAVVAEDKYTARMAAELIEVDYEELPVVWNPEQGMEPGAPLVEPEWGENLTLRREVQAGDVDKAFAEADGIVSGCLKTQRYTATPLEPRGYVASYDRYKDRLTFWASTQCPHPLRGILAESVGIPEASIHVIQPNVGGAFGSKIPAYQEEPLVAYLAYKLQRPVKWVEERNENLMVGGHAREQSQQYEASYKKDGTVTGLKVKIVADVGAPSALAGWEMTLVTTFCIPATYKIPNCHIELFPVITNKCPWNAYRGYGKEAASFLMDRVMDNVAKATGLDRAEVRFKNFIQPEEFPYTQVSGVILDSGDYPKALARALEMIDYKNFPKMQEEARKQGRYIGIGLGQELVAEGCALPNTSLVSAYDGTTVRVSPSGQVTVLTGVTSPGSGSETGIAQIVADQIGVEIKDVRVFQGDTELCPYGLGNYSSRSVIVGGSAAHIAAQELRDKMFKVAGRMLEVLPEDLEAEDGKIYPKGAPAHSLSVQEVASMIYRNPYSRNVIDVEPGLESTRYFRHPNVYHDDPEGRFSAYPSWPNAAVACIVEVDPETGLVKVLRFCMVHDCGVVINPMMAEGNIHGGIAQGLGGALYEHLVYDENGQLKTATLMDYTLPTAVEVPSLEVEHQVTPSPFTPIGTKGVGESGVTGILGAVCGAIENALPHLNVSITETPLKPELVWQAIQNAQQQTER